MKKFISISILIILVTACSTSESETPNTAPTAPTSESPKEGCLAPAVEFKWTVATDPDGNPITYEVQVSEKSNFTPIAKTQRSAETTLTVELEGGKSYYWRVKTVDDKNASSAFSEVLNFTTAATKPNQLPNPPVLVAPVFNSKVTLDNNGYTNLKWTATDPDGDKLVYDVYLDNSNPPTTKLNTSQSIEETNKTVNLWNNGLYFWRVVARDTNGNETQSQVWTFTTAAYKP